MFETGITELILVFVIGLLILGPERLPRVAAQIGRWVAKARRMANQLRYQLEREIALEELYKTQKQKPKPTASPNGSAPDASAAGPAATDKGAGAEASTASPDAAAAATSVAGAETTAPSASTESRAASAGSDAEGSAADEDSAELETVVETADGEEIREAGNSR